MHPILASLLRGHDVADLVLAAMPILFIPLASLRMLLKRSPTTAGQFPRLRYYRRSMTMHWLLIGGIAWMWMLRGRPFAALGLDVPLSPAGRNGLIMAAAVAVCGLVYLLADLLRKPHRDKLLSRHRATLLAPLTPGEVALFAPVAISAGVFEELIYRGFLIWFLAPATGVWAAVGIAALVFGLGHTYQGLRGVLATGGVGLVLGLLFVLSGSLWWIMAVHAIIDLQYFVTGLFVARRGTASKAGVVNAAIV